MQQSSSRNVIVVLAVLVALVGVYFAFTQTNQSVEAAASTLADAQQTYADDAAAVRQYPVLRVERERTANELAQIPVGNLTQPAFVEYLSALARHHHVRVARLTFLAATPPPAPPSTPASTVPGADSTTFADAKPTARPTDAPQALPLAPVSSRTFIEHGMKITMSGQYRDVLFAIADLSRGQALVRVDGPPTTTTSESRNNDVNAEFPATLLEVNSDVIKLQTIHVPPAVLGGPHVFHGVPIQTGRRSSSRALHHSTLSVPGSGSTGALLPAIVVPVRVKPAPSGVVVHMTASPPPRTPLMRRASSKRKIGRL